MPVPSLPILKTVVREMFTSERAARVPEPDLVMDDPEKVAAYTRAGREDGVMAPVYLYHCAQICEVIRPGDKVVDLGCGPATQLALVARLNPETEFIGVDLSDDMLSRARAYVEEMGLTNVSFQKCDITALDFLEDASIDAVFTTVVLHHLPDAEHLERTFSEVNRVLKPGGGIYLVDFAHLKSEKSIDYFAYQYADRQPELFTLDYLYSLRAAFYQADFKRLTDEYLTGRANYYTMRPIPFMQAVRSPNRREVPAETLKELAEIRSKLPEHHKTDVKDLISLFGMGGMKTASL